MSLSLLLAVVVAAQPFILSARIEHVAGRVTVRIAGAGARSVEVRREGDEVLVLLEDSPGDLPAPLAAAPPVTGVRFERRDGKMVVHIGVATTVAHEIRRGDDELGVAFEAPSSTATPAAESAVSPEVAELYRSVLPATLAGEAESGVGVVGEAGGPGAAGAAAEKQEQEADTLGLGIGQLTLRPWVSAAYVDAEVIAPDNTVQRQQYVEIAPQLRATMPVRDGSLKASYEPRFRWGAQLEALNRTSHFFTTALALPLGPRFEVHGGDDYSWGIVEADIVDPGREYFSGTARFVRNEARLGARGELGVNLNLDLDGTLGSLRFREDNRFFDYDTRGIGGRLSRELTPKLRLGAGLMYAELSAPTRKEADSQALTADAQLQGDLAPLTTGSITLGYTSQKNPNAPVEGRSYNGLTGGVGIQRSLGRTANLRLDGRRATHASGFQQDGFFVTTAGEAELVLPVPFQVSFRGGAGYHLNEYRVPLSALGSVPREDRITMWSLGLSRPIRRWGYIRADYQRQRRNSNVDAFDHNLRALIVRIGLGAMESATTMTRPCAAFLGLAFLVGGSASGQEATTPAPAAAHAPADLDAGEARASGDYRIGTGDVLEIDVFGNDDLSRTATVQTNGTITLPLLGEVPVAGSDRSRGRRSPDRAPRQGLPGQPAGRGADQGVPQPVRFGGGRGTAPRTQGAQGTHPPDRRPGRGRRLQDARLGRGHRHPHRRDPRPRAATTLTVRLGGALTPESQRLIETVLVSGDIITAATRQYVTVDGEVQRPERYPIEGELTVSGAVSAAGGLTRFGSSDVKVRRVNPVAGTDRDPQGRPEGDPQGQADRPRLLPNDVRLGPAAALLRTSCRG